MKLHECILSLFGGIAIFISAMNMMSSNLQKIAGSKMKLLLTKKANNNLIYAGIGAIIAMVIQSSSAVSVMSIGFVNADILNLSQAAAVIMGANFGSSIIGILASLESLNIDVYFSFVSFIGIVFSFFKNEKLKIIGGIICGLGMIFIGLNLMKESCDHDSFKNILRNILEKIDFPLALLLLGLIFTSLIQSSSAMTGLIIVMVQGGSMDMKSGLFIVLGSNIGTSTTAIISTLGKSINARRTGIIHLIFKTFGTFVFTIFAWIFDEKIINILEKLNNKPAMQIAWFNVFFKLLSTLISLPLINILIIISNKLIKGEKDENKKKQWRKAFKHLNKRFLNIPSIAEEKIKQELMDIIDLSKKNLEINIKELLEQNNKYNEEITVRNDMINYLNRESIKFIVRLSKELKGNISDEINNNFQLFNYIIKIDKYIKEIFEINKLMKKEDIKFKGNEISNLNNMNELILKLFDSVIKYNNKNENKKGEYLILKEKIIFLENKVIKESYNEILKGEINISLGLYFISIMAIFENISFNLEKIISIFKKEIINKKNKSFEHTNNYILLIKGNNSTKTSSSTRNQISLENYSNDGVYTSEKINQSIN